MAATLAQRGPTPMDKSILNREIETLDQELNGLEAEEQALQLLEESLALQRVAIYQEKSNKVCVQLGCLKK